MQVKVALASLSRTLYNVIVRALQGEDDVHIAAHCKDADALLESMELRPIDVVLVDVDLPGSLDAVRRIQRRNAAQTETPETGVILVASRRQRDQDMTIEALQAGAFDFITRPEAGDDDMSVESVKRQLLVKLRSFCSKRIFSTFAAFQPSKPAPERFMPKPRSPGRVKAICIGVSTGGPKVLSSLLPALSKLVDAPILVVQHMPPNFTASLAESLNEKCRHQVVEAKHHDTLKPGFIFIAPGGKHLALTRNSKGEPILTLNEEPPEEGCRPSANHLFRSAAKVLGGDVVAVILTGMGSDGTKGLLDLKKAGAFVIAQDKESSVVWGMPGSAVASGCVDKVLPALDIPAEVAALSKGRSA